MGYRRKWRPSKAQAREFAQRMANDQEFADAYNERKRKREEKRREGSKYDYGSAGGEYVPTQVQNNASMKFLHGGCPDGLLPHQRVGCEMVISAYALNEKTHHDNIHVVNELIRKYEV